MSKQEFITIRISAETKKILSDLAQKEFRTLSQQCTLILTEWLKKHGHLKEKPQK